MRWVCVSRGLKKKEIQKCQVLPHMVRTTQLWSHTNVWVVQMLYKHYQHGEGTDQACTPAPSPLDTCILPCSSNCLLRIYVRRHFSTGSNIQAITSSNDYHMYIWNMWQLTQLPAQICSDPSNSGKMHNRRAKTLRQKGLEQVFC